MGKRAIQREIFPHDSELPLEKLLLKSGHEVICGCDEAGRGPLAGPVVAAAVLYRDCRTLWDCRDSKSLSASQRARMLSSIVEELEFGIGICSEDEICEYNILRASLLAMKKAIDNLRRSPDVILVDGPYPITGMSLSRGIVHGDAKVAVISAASIVAKVTRDELMIDLHEQYPCYGFDRNFGYPTREHRDAIKQFGPCPVHRKTFRGVRRIFSRSSLRSRPANRRMLTPPLGAKVKRLRQNSYFRKGTALSIAIGSAGLERLTLFAVGEVNSSLSK